MRLCLACYHLMLRSPNGTRYKVEDTWFDYGQRWPWTTIIAYHKNGQSWQAINPAQHELILFSDDIQKTVDEIVNYKYWYDPD